MNLLLLIALIPISILLLIAPSHVPTHVFATSNQTSSNETNTLLKQINVELERILVQLQAPPTLPPPPPPALLEQPPPPLNQTLNSTICKEHAVDGVWITCPVFPSGLQPPIPLPPIPPTLTPDCITTVYGVFCPAN